MWFVVVKNIPDDVLDTVVCEFTTFFQFLLACGVFWSTFKSRAVCLRKPQSSRVVNIIWDLFTTKNRMIKLFVFENCDHWYCFYHYKSNGHHKLFISWTLSGWVFTPTNRMVRHFIFGNCDQWRLRICTFNFFKNTISLSFLNVQLVQDPEKVGGVLSFSCRYLG